jgi:hypothetical protein
MVRDGAGLAKNARLRGETFVKVGGGLIVGLMVR